MNDPTTEIRYCVVRTTHKHPHPPANVCDSCRGDLDRWLKTIPDTYAILPTFIEHGTTEGNPDSKATKRSEAAAPMRLEIIDLLDNRHGRRWLGLEPTNDRRGVAGTLKVHADRLHEERPLTAEHNDASVVAACQLLRRHLGWLTEQTWADELYNDLKTVNRTLSDAIGDYRPKPVGACHLPTDDEDSDAPCGGPLLANKYGGVRCGRCHATWDAAHLRQLGLAQAQQDIA
jgi:hypothetical protein